MEFLLCRVEYVDFEEYENRYTLLETDASEDVLNKFVSIKGLGKLVV